MRNTARIGFSIQGEFITNTAREQFYYADRLDYSLNLLKSCLVSDQLTEEQTTMLALRILDGQMEIIGTYPGPDYQVVEIPEDMRDENLGILKHIAERDDDRKRLAEENQNLSDKLGFIVANLPDHVIDKLNNLWYDEGETKPLIYPRKKRTNAEDRSDMPSIVRDYMQQARIERNMPDEEHYGWLEPNGTFHPVPWGEHQTWAYEYIKSEGWEETPRFNDGCCGDILLKHNWILLHSTAMGLARPQWNPERRVTKAQREFLYDYYVKRECFDEAQKWLDA